MSEPRQTLRVGNLSGDFWQRQGDIGMQEYKDIYPDDEAQTGALGLFARMANRWGIAQYTNHFREDVIPAGYAWVNDGTFNGLPNIGAYMWIPSFFAWQAQNNPPYFLAQAPFVPPLFTSTLVARMRVGRETEIGVRIDDGSNNNYGEGVLDPDNLGGYRVDFRWRSGGGAVTDVQGPYYPGTEYVVLFVQWSYGGRVKVYTVGEEGLPNFPTGFDSGLQGWTPSRIGFVLYGPATTETNMGLMDWFLYEEVEW